MNESVYRQAGTLPTRRLDQRATVMAPFWWVLALIFLIVAVLPFAFMPTRVVASCAALSDHCEIRTQRVFGLIESVTEVSLAGSGYVRIVTPGKGTFLEVETGGRVQRQAASFGGGSDFVLDVLRKFRAPDDGKRLDVTGVHADAVKPILALIAGLLVWLAFLTSLVAKVRIEVESDDVQMMISVARWPLRARTYIFPTEDVKGADVRHISRRTSKGGTVRTRTIDLRLRTHDEDLFPRALPDSVKVDQLAFALDRFLRTGQTGDEQTNILSE